MNSVKGLVRSLPGALQAKNVLEYYRSLAKGTFSQHGEDTFILNRLGNTGFYVDVGANDPHRLSNTYGLYLRGWGGITIEPIRALYEKHKKMRPRDRQFNVGLGGSDHSLLKFYELDPHVLSTFDERTATAYIGGGIAKKIASYNLPIRSLTSVLDEVAPHKIDLLSIDVEGFELPVLKGFDFSKYHPRMIILEAASAIGENSDTHEVDDLLAVAGYKPTHRLGANMVYEPADAGS
jgi:FkbM family methyltransferase